MSRVVAAVRGAIEAYRALVQLTPVAFEGEIEQAGTDVVVRGPGGDARGPLSAAFLLGAHASARLATPRDPTLRFHDVALCLRQSAPVYRAISAPLFELGVALHHEGGHGDEPLFLFRQATLGGDLHDWRSTSPVSAAQIARAPRELVERATTRQIAVPDERVAASTLAKQVAPRAEDDDVLVRHECGVLLAWIAGALTNTSPAPLSATFAPALRALWASNDALVVEQATLTAELFAYRLASEAESWRVSQKKREAAVAALRPLAQELSTRDVERHEQARRLALDATPLSPPAGSENGPWKKEVREALAVRAARGLDATR